MGCWFVVEADRYHFLKPIPIFEVKYRPIGDNTGGRYYRASLIIAKFEFAYRPIFKRSNIGR